MPSPTARDISPATAPGPALPRQQQKRRAAAPARLPPPAPTPDLTPTPAPDLKPTPSPARPQVGAGSRQPPSLAERSGASSPPMPGAAAPPARSCLHPSLYPVRMPRRHRPAAQRAAEGEMWGWRGAQPRVPVGWAREGWDRPRLLPVPEQPRTWRDTEVKALASDGLSSVELISREPEAAQLWAQVSSQRRSVLLCSRLGTGSCRTPGAAFQPSELSARGRGFRSAGQKPRMLPSPCIRSCLSLCEKGTLLKYCAG